MRPLFTFILCLLLTGFASAQDAEQTPYEIALQRIEEARVTGVTKLELDNLDLREVPPEIAQLEGLRELYLNDNQLNYISPEITELTNLEVLFLGRNLIDRLPPEIENLNKLRFLALETNQLTTLPTEIGLLSNLERIFLNDNQITELPNEIGNLRQLCYLRLDNNDLKSLPIELGQVQSLSTNCPNTNFGGLYLEGNPLISPPPEVIAQGTAAVLDYLRNQAAWHLQRLILSGTGFIAIITLSILGLRWRNHRHKRKKKNASPIP